MNRFRTLMIRNSTRRGFANETRPQQEGKKEEWYSNPYVLGALALAGVGGYVYYSRSSKVDRAKEKMLETNSALHKEAEKRKAMDPSEPLKERAKAGINAASDKASEMAHAVKKADRE